MAAILRFAKIIPPKRPVFHPVTQELIPLTRSTCHSCGREFYHRPRGKNFEPNPDRKYCHHTCQNSRPNRFDLWLERKIMEILKTDHGVDKEEEISGFQVVSSDTIEEHVFRAQEKMFTHGKPLHLTERIRQAARRLVGIPGRGGDQWQAVALEEITDEESEEGKTWVRRVYAPARGQIMLGLAKAESFGMDFKELTLDEAGLEGDAADNHTDERKINGVVLKEPPEWGGNWRLDDAGRVRQVTDTKPAPTARVVSREAAPGGEDLLGGKWAKTQRTKLQRHLEKGVGWSKLLKQNQDIIDTLASERDKELGL